MASQHSRIVEAAKMWFIPWGMLCLLWLLFVAKLSWYEVFVGMSASALATIGFRLVSSRSAVTFNPKMGWLLHIWRLPWLMLHDGWLVLRHLCNPLIRGTHHPGVFQTLRFASEANDARPAARRVLAITYLTLPPNSIAIDIDQQARLIWFHRLEQAKPPQWLQQLEGS
jgi:multisubunit Na+/H+ antiporter MnhE subunit